MENPVNQIVTYTDQFRFIKFDGQNIINQTQNSFEKNPAIKELRLLKKMINAEKKSLNIQIREQKASLSGVRLGTAFPKRGLGKAIGMAFAWARFGIRVHAESQNNSLQQWKTFYDHLLLRCDYLEIEINNL